MSPLLWEKKKTERKKKRGVSVHVRIIVEGFLGLLRHNGFYGVYALI